MSGSLALITGSCSLIGCEVCFYFDRLGFRITGIDNNQRAIFFGPEGDTSWMLQRLRDELDGYSHYSVDIRDRDRVLSLFSELKPAVIIHTAAQPSHDRAASIPFDDFDVNAVGTLNLLEATRRSCADSPFIHMSTNKVYGDLPNHVRLRELDTRWDFDDPDLAHGIPENVDQSRVGDHICYYSDLRKMKSHYPSWTMTKNLTQIFTEIATAWKERSRTATA